jgi:polar amino acid transport system permease protein
VSFGSEAAKIQPEILMRIGSAQAAARSRNRLISAFVWAALTIGFVGGMMLAGDVDPAFFIQSGPVILFQGAPITILVCVVSIVVATILAVFGALARLSTNPAINAVASFYVSLIRGTPLIVQIFFIYYALPQAGIILDAIPAGIIALSLNYGAYMTEIFRAGIQAVPRGQSEAAQALGIPERLVFRRIVLPQAVRIVTPAIANDFIAMLKDSALIATIGVRETLFLGQRIGRSEFEPIAALLIVALVYWGLTILFSYFQDKLERRMARGDR